MVLKVLSGVLIILAVIVAAVSISYVNAHPPVTPFGNATTATEPNAGLPMQTVTIGNTTLQVEVASTDAERQQGLSGRASLPQGQGMLFTFPQPGNWGFWMKDMQFSLDIIFADASGSIVTIDPNLSPATYLTNPPQVFYPAVPAQYVLEVPAGYAAAAGIAVGQHIVVGQ